MKYYFLLFIGFVCLGCSAQSDCEKFKNGKFKLDDLKLGFESIIERNDSIQVERNLTMNTVSKFKITWKNSCEYSLDIISGNDELVNAFKGKTLNVKIISTHANEYTFEAWIDGIDHVATQTVKRIE